MRKFGVIVLLAVFLLTSITAVAKTSNSSAPPGYKRIYIEKPMLFGVDDNYYDPGPSLKFYSPPPDYFPAGNWRQVYELETTQHDRQHYSSSGRQIVYAGYWNAGCDYIYMNWSGRMVIGSSIILQCKTAIFDWAGGVWDYTAGGSFQAGPSGSFQNLPYTFAPNIGITPDNPWAVSSMSVRNEAEAWKSYIAYGTAGCPTSSYLTHQALPGPPNLEGITNGYCDENLGDETVSPYLWPIIDLDTIGDVVITHLVHQEWGFCDASQADANNIDAASLIYQRKIATSAGSPETGTWDGPHFIDSVYNIAYIVRADHRPGNHNVYVAYMKPMYYQYDGAGGSPCAGTGAYQLHQDIVYVESTDDGDNWSAPIYVTDFKSGYEDDRTQPAAYEITGFVDPTGVFHLVWTAINNDEACSFPVTAKLYHWDNSNNCISLVYDGSEPALFPGWSGGINAWNLMLAKPNISWCDDKLYVSFVRYGAHTTTNDNGELVVDDICGTSSLANTDILVAASDATGSMGQVWSDAVNVTNTITDSCLTGECESEHWATMAMYSTDSLMIEYILDLEAGSRAGPNDPNEFTQTWTDNPVIFMTWPCFTMADLPQNNCISTSPSTATFDEVALAPDGNTAPPCNTPASVSKDVIVANCGNVNYTYSAASNDGWLTIDGGASGSINAGTGPNYSDNPAWGGAPACAAPATISWTASSATLGEGNYTGTISVDIVEAGVDDFDITVNLVVTCEYYVPEYARITGGCWSVDLWNTPQAAAQTDPAGNMQFYACGGDSITPLYHEALAVGWQEGGVIKMYSDAVTQDSGQLHMRALSDITTSEVGDPGAGSGYYKTQGYWSTPDSSVQGMIEYFVPGHQDTSVLIEKVTLWNTAGVSLGNFILGEESDWDCDPDSSVDEGHIDLDYEMVYMTGDHNGTNIAAGLRPFSGTNSAYGARAINGYDYAYYTLGWYPDTLYNKLQSVSGAFSLFTDSVNGTEMRILNVFYGGTLGATDTLEICKVKAVSLTGQPGLQDLMDKGFAFIENYGLACQGRCGDANNDGSVNVSDAVWIINFAFVGGDPPQPIPACGDANSDASVNVSDAVWVINYAFVGGDPPNNCSPGSWPGGDCCPF